MKCKAFEAIVELEVQAVTCPGVWLCPNGKVTTHFYVFGSCAHTEGLEPVFPLLYHETFIFRKSFSNVRTLNELDRFLDTEMLYVELIQWENSEKGNILATFETTLTEVLYPEFQHKCVIPGVDVDLLMRTTKYFPGIIAPKIEMTTKTTIEEVLCSFRNDRKKGVVVVNPKMISSKCSPKRRLPLRQKKVCHSSAYHSVHIGKKPKKVVVSDREYNFTSPRSPRYTQKECNCNEGKKTCNKNDYLQEKLQKLRQSSFVSGIECLCNLKSTRILCPLCTKYKYYFEKPCGCNQNSGLLCDCKMRKHFQHREIPGSDLKKKQIPRKINCCQNERKSRDYEDKSTGFYYDEYKSQVKPSLATEIHNRLQRALGTINDTNDSPSPIDSLLRENVKQDSNQESCREKFYKNLEDFYKQLYKRACYKSSHEICKNKAFNT